MNFSITFYISIAVLGLMLLPHASLRPSDGKPFFDRVISKEMQGFLSVFIIFHQTVITLCRFRITITTVHWPLLSSSSVPDSDF